MKTARKANIEAALLGNTVTIVRGDAALTIPVRELQDIRDVLGELAADVSAEAPAPTADPAPSPPVVEEPSPRRGARGRIWDGVKASLAQHGRAQSFNTLLRFVKDQQLTDRDPEHALRIALGKKVISGDLVRTRAGRYALQARKEGKAASAAVGTKKSPPQGKRKQRPGELWKRMSAHLADYPDGRSLGELIEAAEAGNWTNAQSARHAVKICLGRVGAQIERLDDGRFKLPGLPAPVVKDSTVRRRRKAG